MPKRIRQQKLIDLIHAKSIGNQRELLQKLIELGVDTNQATISRDLNELGIAKVQGIYRTPQASNSRTQGLIYSCRAAGDHLLVVHTSLGRAMAVAAEIDDAKRPDVVGTVAGDDTIFIATESSVDQKRIKSWLLTHFNRS